MQPIAASLENKLWFWIFTGPALVMVALFVAFCKQGPEVYYFPLVGVVGLALSTLWHRKGLILACALLIAAASIFFHDLPAGGWWWHALLTLSLGLSFTIASLAFAEMVDRVGGLQTEARSHLQRFLHLDEESKRSQQILERRCHSLEAAAADARSKLNEWEEQSAAEQQLEQIKEVELEALARENAELKQRAPSQPEGHWRAQVAELEDRIEELAIALAEANGQSAKGEEVALMQARIAALEEELVSAQKRLADRAGLRDELNDVRVDRFQLKLDLESKEAPLDMGDELAALASDCDQAEGEVTLLEGVVENLLSELRKRCLPSGFRTPPR